MIPNSTAISYIYSTYAIYVTNFLYVFLIVLLYTHMITATDKDREACFAFLNEQEYAVVATTNAKGIPDAAVVTYLLDDEHNLYFFTRKQTTKSANLDANSNISLVVGTGPASVTAQIYGTAQPLDESQADTWMNRFLVEREGFYMTFLKLEGYDFVGYKVTLSKIKWLHIDESEAKEDIILIEL